MPEKLEYAVAEHYDKSEFINLVNMFLDDDWVIQGGVAIAYRASCDPPYHSQAFIRPKNHTERKYANEGR